MADPVVLKKWPALADATLPLALLDYLLVGQVGSDKVRKATLTSVLDRITSLYGIADGLAQLDGDGKLKSAQIPASLLGGVRYQGTWNATTNSPNLAASSPQKGYYYVVSVAGGTNLGGITSWNVRDMAIYNGSAWEQIDNTDAVLSIFGRTGAITAQVGDYSSFYQGLDADLTAIAALTTTTFGRDFLTLANSAALIAKIGYTPANKAGDTFGGAVLRDANFGLDIVSTKPRLTLDSTDYVEYDRAANTVDFYVAGLLLMSLRAGSVFINAGNTAGVGGKLTLAKPGVGSGMTGDLIIQIASNGGADLLQIFDTGGTNKGVSLPLTTLAAAVGSTLRTAAEITAEIAAYAQPKFTRDVKRMTSTQSTTSATLTDVTQLTSASLPVGSYLLSAVIAFQTAATTTGMALSIAGASSGGATIAEVVGSARIRQAADGVNSWYEGDITAANDAVTSTSVVAANTTYAATMLVAFRVTVAGAVCIRYASEVGASACNLQIGSSMLIEQVA